MVSSNRLLFISLTYYLTIAHAHVIPSDLVVDLGYTRYQGKSDNSTQMRTWNNIKYAAAPIGHLRWRAPLPVESIPRCLANEVQNASDYGPRCFQGAPGGTNSQTPAGASIISGSGPNSEQSEDCLLLNIISPLSPRKLLPVLFQIHGGGYVAGNSLSSDGTSLVAESHGEIVYVEIQYRLGGFGFLAGEDVMNDGSANVGLLDQRAALEWVQRHIHHFDGDPDRVTIIGGSAGGGSVTAQLQLYGGLPKPPFRAAIALFPWWQPFHNTASNNLQYRLLLEEANCNDLECLRCLPAHNLSQAINLTYSKAYQQKLYGFGDFYYGPTIDGKTITELPSQAFDSGHFSKVPLITSRNSFEGTVFSNLSIKTEQELHEDLQQLWPAATDAFFDDLNGVYPVTAFNGSYFTTPPVTALAPSTILGSGLASAFDNWADAYGVPAYWRRQAVFGDAFVGCGTRIIAAAAHKYGVPSWKFIFNDGLYIHGASEMAILSPTTFPSLINQAGRTQLVEFILDFARGADPNGNRSDALRPKFPLYGPGSEVLNFNSTGVMVSHDPDDGTRCDFIRKYSSVVQN